MPGIAKSVADNLFEIGKSAVAGTAGAVSGIASESIEQVTGAPSQVAQAASDKQTEIARDRQKEEKISQDKRRFEEVRSELASYTQRKQSLDMKIAEEKAAERREQEKKGFEKKKKESFTQNLLKKLSAGSHGETDRQKE